MLSWITLPSQPSSPNRKLAPRVVAGCRQRFDSIEAENAFALSVVKLKALPTGCGSEKASEVKKSGLLRVRPAGHLA